MDVALDLDTNVYSDYLRGDPLAIFVLDRAPSMALSPVVIGELKSGFGLGSSEQRNLDELRRFLKSPRLQVPPVDDAVTSAYARVYKQLRRDGRPIPTNDIWIAAFAVSREAALFTRDRHFEWVDGLRVVRDRGGFQNLLG